MIRSSWKLGAVALVASFAAVTSPASASEIAQRIDAYVEPLVDAGQFSGCILAVEDGEVVYRVA